VQYSVRIFFWFIALLPLFGFWTYGLFDLDEGIYAASLRGMILNNDWVVPSYLGNPFFEKPILVYWLSWLSLGVSFSDMFALRLPSVVACIGTLLLVFQFLRIRYDDATAMRAVIVLSASPLFMGVGRMMMPDALLYFFLSGALLCFWISLERSKHFRIYSGVCLGFATLAKGPVAVAFFLLVLVFCYLFLIDKREKFRGYWVPSLIAFFIVICLWYLPVFLRQGNEFFTAFLWEQNIGRFLGGDKSHLGPIWFYIPVLLLSLAPFTFLVFKVWRRTRENDFEVFLWIWFFIVFLFFSLSGSKLPHYILPMFPPFAMLIGISWSRMKKVSMLLAPMWGLLFGGAIIILHQKAEGLEQVVLILGIVAFVSGIVSYFVRLFLNDSFASFAIVAYSFCVYGLVFGVPVYWLSTHGDVYTIAQTIKKNNLPVIQFRMEGLGERLVVSHPSLIWYVGTTMPMITTLDDLLELNKTEKLVITRRNRLGKGAIQALKLAGWEVELIEQRGEFSLFHLQPSRS
jgi:4-amino-4-deoxy-L-arabinose transferase-like glycosyltransferase